MLTPYLPYPLLSGGQIRTYNLLKNLSQKHQITLFSLIKNESDQQYIENIAPYCHKVKVFKRSKYPFTPRNIIKAGISRYPFVVTRNLVSQTKTDVEAELAKENYDVIHAETFYMMPNIPQTLIPVILVEQTIEYLGYQSYAHSSRLLPLKPFFYIDIQKIKYWEQYYWRHCDRLIAMSQDDAQFIKKEVTDINHVDVVANGIDVDFFNQTKNRLPKNPTVLIVGTFKWLPNVEAVTYLVEHIWPRVIKKIPHAKLHIVGYSPTQKILSYQKDPSITVSGSVKDIREAYGSAHILLAPVKSGKGTRYKILEAMATRTPIVATPLAVEGIEGIENGKHVLVGQTSEELADLTIKLLTDKTMRQLLSRESKALVDRNYNWHKISQSLDHIYQEIGV